MKTFAIRFRDKNGNIVRREVEQVATFTHRVGDTVERFVITKVNGQLGITHRNTTARVCSLSNASMQVCAYDKIAAAKHTLDKLINDVGVARFEAAARKAQLELGE